MPDKMEKTVKHVAIIMDGNGRWAKENGLKHLEGHKEGSKAVQRVIEAAEEFGVKYITLYAFSTENWKRPKMEVDGLMMLLRTFFDENLKKIIEKGVRVKAIGRLNQIPILTRKKLMNAVKVTAQNTKGTVILAINYGGRAEIVDAAKKIAQDAIDKKINIKNLDEELFSDYLYDSEIPDPELMIRTSGEFRLSNFLLWQLSYSEIYISDIYWPDFGKDEFKKALDCYYKRNRRFGGRK